jgi:hypothetical protein
MALALAFLGLLTAVVPWLISRQRRREAIADSPETEKETALRQADEQIAKGAAGITDINSQIQHDLDAISAQTPKP